MRGNRIKEQILRYIDNVREKYPQVTDEMLCGEGVVYYMNGNDGTEFDWNWNDRCCEFFQFYKETELGFIKVYVNSDDTLSGYVWLDNGYGEAIHLPEERLKNGDALYLASLLYQEADGKGIWDEDIYLIDFEAKPKHILESEDDEDEYIDEYEEEEEW